MTKEERMLQRKRAASAFYTDGPDIGDASEADWATAEADWLVSLAKLAVDTKRSKKARDAAESLHQRAEAAGLTLVSHEQTVEEYDTAMAKLGAEVERLRAEVASLKGADQ
jgi:uncharacterized small protein (DUF1192 family)